MHTLLHACMAVYVHCINSATFRFGAFQLSSSSPLTATLASLAVCVLAVPLVFLCCFCLSQSLCNADAVHYLQLIELNQSINFQFSRTISDKYNFFFGYMPVGRVRPLKTILNGLNMRSMLTYCFFSFLLVKYSPIFSSKCTHQPALNVCAAIL